MANRYPTLELYVPSLFASPEFAEWVNRRVGKGLATWHTGGPMHETSDVFVLYDRGNGDASPSDPEGMPGWCWAHLCRCAQRHQVTHGVLRLVNAEGDEDDAADDRPDPTETTDEHGSLILEGD